MLLTLRKIVAQPEREEDKREGEEDLKNVGFHNLEFSANGNGLLNT